MSTKYNSVRELAAHKKQLKRKIAVISEQMKVLEGASAIAERLGNSKLAEDIDDQIAELHTDREQLFRDLAALHAEAKRMLL